MIIWGSKGKKTTIGHGTFFCPNCRRRCSYEHMRISKYFTLYFIPLIKTSDLGEYVECQSCFMTFKPEILQHSGEIEEQFRSQMSAAEAISTISQRLDEGIPFQAIAGSLIEAGASEEDAAKVIYAASRGKVVRCPQCGLAYKPSISFCSVCGSKLG